MRRPIQSELWDRSARTLSCVALGAAVAAFNPRAEGTHRAEQPPAQPPEQAPPPSPVPPQPDGIYEGRVIRKVILQRPLAQGPDDPARYGPLDPDVDGLARRQLRAIEGAPYVQATVSGDIGRLNRIGRFGQIENRVQLLDDGSVILVYTLTPRPVVKSVQSVGNRQISDQDIGKETEILVGTPVDRYRLDQACRSIERLYREKGYYLAKVTVDDRELEASGAVLFIIREGERLKVTDIRFEGNKSFSPKELRTAIKTREVGILEKGVLDDEILENDVAGLILFYKDRGYLDVRASRTVRQAPNGREAIVVFLVEEGPIYTLRDVKAYYQSDNSKAYKTEEEARAALKPGEHILPWSPTEFVVFEPGALSSAQVQGLMDIKAGDVYSQDKLRVSMEKIREAFGKMGYVDVALNRRELRDPEKPFVDVLITIRQGLPFKVGEVIITGNHVTQDKVIRRLIPLEPGRPADMTQLEDGKTNLTNSRLFAQPSLDNPQPIKLTVQPPDPIDPDFRDILVEVTETNTGSFQVGASVNSDSGVVGRVAMTQRNFDVTDTPDSAGELLSAKAFRGGGQTFSIELMPGDEVETYRISLLEPSLFDSDLSGNASLFYYSRDYDEFDEVRAGTRLGLGRRFGTRWVGNIPIRLEAIEITNLEPDSPTDAFDSDGDSTLSSIGLTLTRSSFDHPIRATRGSRLEFSVDQVGALGGDYSFTALRGEHAVLIPVYEDFLNVRTVLSFNTRVGYMPQGRSEVPIFERLFLGGTTFRGFEFRGVSPRGVANDTGLPSDDPIGGTWMFFWGAEIRQPIYKDTISVVGFVDTGTVTFEPGFDDYRVSAGFGLRLYVPGLSPAPLAFDFGFPILSQPDDAERVFSFSIDVPWN